MTTFVALSPAQTLQTTSTTYTYDVQLSTAKYIAFRFQPSSIHAAMQLDNVKYGANLAVNEGVNISRNLKMAVSLDNNFLKFVTPNSLSKAVIYSAAGQMVTEEKIINNSLNIATLKVGVYFITIEDVAGQRNQSQFIKK